MYKYAETGIGPRVLSRSISGARADQTAGSESGGPVPAPAWLRGCLPPLHSSTLLRHHHLPPPLRQRRGPLRKKKTRGKKSPPPCCCRLFGLDRGPPLPSKSAGSRPVSSPTPPAGSLAAPPPPCWDPPFNSRLLQIFDPSGGGGGRQPTQEKKSREGVLHLSSSHRQRLRDRQASSKQIPLLLRRKEHCRGRGVAGQFAWRRRNC